MKWQNKKNAHTVLETITGKNVATSNQIVALTVSKPTPTSKTKARKKRTNHSVFSKECRRMRRIESIIVSKNTYYALR